MSNFINDIKIIGSKSIRIIIRIKIELITIFNIVDIRPISFYLDVEVERD